MNFTFKKKGIDKIEANVELGKEDLKTYVERAEDEIGAGLEIEGFRKGKVPKDLLRERVGSSKILEVAMETAVRDSLSKVVEEQGFDVLETSQLEIKENSPDRLVYRVLLTISPEIIIPDLTNFKVAHKIVEVEDKEVDDTIESIRASMATFINKEGRAEEGDRIEIDFEASIGGKPIEGGISKNHPLIIGGKSFMPGFEEKLIGVAKGEKRTFSIVAPPDYYRKELASKSLDFVVTINNVQESELPQLDDNFARGIGRFDDLNHLMKSIKEGIKKEKEIKERQRMRLEILDHIIKTTDISIPELLIEQQLDSMVSNLDKDLHKSGLEIGPYLAHLGKTMDELRKGWRDEAGRQIKIALILRAIARKEHLTVEPKEIEAAMKEAMEAAMTREQIEKNDIDLELIRKNVVLAIINEKALMFLEKKCVRS